MAGPPPIAGPQYQQNINVGAGRDAWGNSQIGQRDQGLGAAAAMRSAYQPDVDPYSIDQQHASTGILRSAAEGNQPSSAQLMGQQAIGQSLNAQLAGAASAKGGALGQAAAMRQAQGGAAAFQQQAIGGLAAGRAAEMAQARGEYANATNAMRGQDLQYAGLQSQNENTQRGLNQQAQMGYEGMSNQADYQQAQADLGVAGMNSGNWQSWQNQQQIQQGENARLDKQLAMQRQQQQQQMIMAGVGGAAAMGGAVLTGGASAAAPAMAGAVGGNGGIPPLENARADGGPVSSGKPYLVGERGPELVVPRNDGHVVPAEQTSALMGDVLPLYEPPGKLLQQSATGHAYYADPPSTDDGRPSLAGQSPAPQHSLAMAADHRAKMAPRPTRRPTPEELMAEAMRMEQEMRASHEARMARGPAVGPASLGQAAYQMQATR